MSASREKHGLDYAWWAMIPMSVLLVTPRWTRDGGVATHAIASASALAEHGLDVSVAAAHVDVAASPPNVTVFHAPRLFDTALAPAERLGGALSSLPTAIHIHQVDDPEIVTFVRRSAPTVLSAHGYTACTSGVHYFEPGHECARPHGAGCMPNLALRGCAHTRQVRRLPAAYRRVTRALAALGAADLVVSYSSAVDRHLSANGLVRRAVIPLFTTIPAEARPEHAARRRVVFAGRIVAPKGIDVLIRAAQKVDGEFVVCGDGWRLDRARRLVRRLGVEDRVHFRGWLGTDALARELAEASVLAMPSVWPEPFGLVGIEAFAAGRPVVASATGGVRDWLRDGVNGLAVEPGDHDALAHALNELLADPDRCETMGAAGRRLAAERFTAERHVSALLDAYRSARSGWEARAERMSQTAPPTPL